jgi:halogenation protein CepH
MNFSSESPNHIDSNAPVAFNVERSRFDQILLNNAVRQGVDVRHKHDVRSVLSDNGRISGVEYLDSHGQSGRAHARFVVDAGGHRGRLSAQLGKRRYSDFFRKVSAFGYFENGDRLEPPLAGNVFFETVDDAWLWYIPLSETLTSVGVVVPDSDYKNFKGEPRGCLEHYLSKCPKITELLKDARYSEQAPYDEIRTRGEYSYANSVFWQPGGIIIGDAAGLVDVLLSSGTHLATYAALLVARSINSVLDYDMDEAVCLNEFEARLRYEFVVFYQGLMGLYDMTETGDAYVLWLRNLLKNSNGVFVEWQEKRGALPLGSILSANRSAAAGVMNAQNVHLIRNVCDEILAYCGPAVMEIKTVLPDLTTALTPSEDHLYWAYRSACA